jgi:acyl-CoA synthetase (AMP-forming)/AMP-acid ligase II
MYEIWQAGRRSAIIGPVKELAYPKLFLPAVAQRAADTAFVLGDDHRLTFGQHTETVIRLADACRSELGLERGSRFAVLSLNSHRFAALYHAAFLGAGIINPLNIRFAPRELHHALADSGAEVVFVDRAFAPRLAEAMAYDASAMSVRTVVALDEGTPPTSHDVTFDDLVAAGSERLPAEPEEDDPVLLIYTGGTTGLPKGVLCDHRSQVLNVYHVAAARGLGTAPGAVHLHHVPMFHTNSLAALLCGPVFGQVGVILPMFDVGAVLEAVERHGVTELVLVPTMIAMLLQHPEFRPERLASLQYVGYGSAPMPPALLDRLMELFPRLQFIQGYGMTESSGPVTILPPEDHLKGPELLRSVGRPVPGMEVRIEGPDGSALPPGEEGEICVRGGNLMRGYWNRPEQTEEAFRGGWYHTGDVGRVDEHGYLYLVDRAKDMIISGGENVYSLEVENAISSHPAVAQVAVIGIPHDLWGEQVHAVVVLKPGSNATAEELRDHARESIAGYKVPKTFDFRTEPLPLSATGKVVKDQLRKEYARARAAD